MLVVFQEVGTFYLVPFILVDLIASRYCYFSEGISTSVPLIKQNVFYISVETGLRH